MLPVFAWEFVTEFAFEPLSYVGYANLSVQVYAYEIVEVGLVSVDFSSHPVKSNFLSETLSWNRLIWNFLPTFWTASKIFTVVETIPKVFTRTKTILKE